jgi:inosose dehydratase
MIKATGLATGSLFLGQVKQAQAESTVRENISSQHYTWKTFLDREGKTWDPSEGQMLELYKSTGLTTFEPSFGQVSEVKNICEALKRAKIATPSMYINSTLHDQEQANTSITEAIKIAEAVQPYGVKIVVTNPNPIRWNSPETKTDKQLKVQAGKLEELGKKLKGLGMSLAYHTHDAEMKRGAREFHHMMLNTSPENVKLCLDSHWIYRGTEDSQVALFDIVKLYADRVVEVHLRQSKNSIWSEFFEEGDLNYPHLAEMLEKKNIKPLLVLEQAVEKGTPHTTTTVEAIRKSLAYVDKVFS